MRSGWSFEDHPQHRRLRVRARERRLHGLRRPVGEQAECRPHVARRRAGLRGQADGPHPRPADPRRGRAGRRGRGRVGDAGRARRVGHRARPARDRRRGLPRVARAADSLRRSAAPPSARTSASIPAPRSSGCTAPIRRSWWGPPQAGLCDEFATRRRLRNADRDGSVRAGARRVGDPLDLGRRSQGAHGELPLRGHIHLADTRSRSRKRHDRPERRGDTSLLGDGRPRRREPAQGARRPGPPARGGRRPHDRRPGGDRADVRRGDDFESFVAGIQRIPFRAGGQKMFSAHQMGTCRMGPDPTTSVADPCGELHDTPGVGSAT